MRTRLVRGRVPRSRSEEAEALQSELLIRTKAWEKAEAGFTLANAVRVAGPDRILVFGAGFLVREARDHQRRCDGHGETCVPKLWLDHRFIHQQDRNVVPHRIHAVALPTLQAFARFLLHQRLFANRTDQDVEQFL